MSKRLSDEQRQAIARRYAIGESPAMLAVEFGMSRQTINTIARNADLPRCAQITTTVPCGYCGNEMGLTVRASRSVRRRKFCSRACANAGNSRHQRLSEATIESGYRMVAVPDGHISRTSTRQAAHRIREHILLGEGALGRPLKRGEVVHHVNGDSLDNRPENLLVCMQAYHAMLHAKMSYLFQREHFA